MQAQLRSADDHGERLALALERLRRQVRWLALCVPTLPWGRVDVVGLMRSSQLFVLTSEWPAARGVLLLVATRALQRARGPERRRCARLSPPALFARALRGWAQRGCLPTTLPRLQTIATMRQTAGPRQTSRTPPSHTQTH